MDERMFIGRLDPAYPGNWNREQGRVPDGLRQTTGGRHKIFVFADRKAETGQSLTSIINSRASGAVLSSVPCVDIDGNKDVGSWHHHDDSGPLDVIGFYSAAARGLSEDAEPLMVAASLGRDGKRVLIGVFDGMGGAGASIVEREHNLTEAYRASRIARRACSRLSVDRMLRAMRSPHDELISGAELREALVDELQSAARSMGLGAGSSRLRGTMTKTLPTTLACADMFIRRNEAGQVQIHVQTLWAGDSRIWILSPSSGLQQLTRDDVDMLDPLEQLRQDPPLTNMVSASVDFMVNERMHRVTGPCIVLAGTDGLSGYVRSPGEVELHVLEAFRKAEDQAPHTTVRRALLDKFPKLAHDDVSCAIAVIGFEDVRAVNRAFRERLNSLRSRYASLRRDLTADQLSESVDAVWANERALYCERLGIDPGGMGHG